MNGETHKHNNEFDLGSLKYWINRDKQIDGVLAWIKMIDWSDAGQAVIENLILEESSSCLFVCCKGVRSEGVEEIQINTHGATR